MPVGRRRVILRATLLLVPEADLRISPGAGKLTHALAFELIRTGDPKVAQWLHPGRGARDGGLAIQGGRPAMPSSSSLLATSGVVTSGHEGVPDLRSPSVACAGQPLFVRVTVLGARAAAALRVGLDRTPEVRLAGVSCRLQGARLEQTTLAELWAGCGPRGRLAVVEFRLRPRSLGARRLELALPHRSASADHQRAERARASLGGRGQRRRGGGRRVPVLR